MTYSEAPPLTIDTAKTYAAVLHTTAGDITLRLYADLAPLTVNNFVFLAEDDYYEGTIFHRVISGFMVQTGDPTGTGTGGPGYKFRDERHSITTYPRGRVAMANAGPNTNGSQFFIMHADYGLPNQYTIFGEVTDGIEVVDRIAAEATGTQDRPLKPPAITSVSITVE